VGVGVCGVGGVHQAMGWDVPRGEGARGGGAWNCGRGVRGEEIKGVEV